MNPVLTYQADHANTADIALALLQVRLAAPPTASRRPYELTALNASFWEWLGLTQFCTCAPFTVLKPYQAVAA